MYGERKFFPFATWLDFVLDEYRTQTFLEKSVLGSAFDERLRSINAALSAFQHLDWQRMYRGFELLQSLPFTDMARCDNPDCPGIVGDGTMGACIRVRHLSVSAPDQEQQERKVVSFQTHTLIKHKALRDLLAKYA